MSHFHKLYLRSIAFGSVAVVLASTALFLYASHLRGCAQRLISASARIKSVGDAQRELATLRRAGSYSVEEYNDGAHQGTRLQMTNGLLSTLRLVPSTNVVLQVTVVQHKMDGVLLGMSNDTSSVWVQESFDPLHDEGLSVHARRNGLGIPVQALLMISSAPSARQVGVFALNASCLVKLRGCETAEQMLPSLLEYPQVPGR